MRNDFAIFILTHGRADKVITAATLEKCGNTNKVYYIIDNEDKQADQYRKNFGEENVIMFDKLQKSKEFDTMDLPSRDRRAIVYARNACFDIAKDLGLTYFLELDDDYTEFRNRYWTGEKLTSVYVKDLDSIIDEMIEFLDTTNAITVAFAQTGDFIGGAEAKIYREKLTRKAMNSFFCRTDKKFDFIGRINEDVNTYVSLGSRGNLLFTVSDIALNQLDSQTNNGGMTDLYLLSGTYVKSFFTVVANPSSVKISEMGCGHRRIHHLVDWEHAVPKIISDKFRKER